MIWTYFKKNGQKPQISSKSTKTMKNTFGRHLDTENVTRLVLHTQDGHTVTKTKTYNL